MSDTAIALPSIPQLGWRKYLWLISPALPAIGLASLLAYYFYGHEALLWLIPVGGYTVAPLMDYLLGEDTINPADSDIPVLNAHRYFQWIVYAFIPFQYAMTIVGAWLAVMHTPSWLGVAGIVATVALLNGIGINTAHELGHKQEKLERWLSKLTLGLTMYGHFFVEHNRGHHKNVATPEDPASSRMGESFWAFLPRTVMGSFRSAWEIEKGRLQRINKPLWSRHNENLQAWAITVIFFALMTAWLGWWALLFLVVQGIYGFSMLEVVNYVEHYGLLRQKRADGLYERCQPQHSWNSNHIFTNLMLYQLQRHSDHHANPSRPYQALRHFEQAPQLPSGYVAMVFLAYFPPVWYWVMDRRVVSHYKGDLTLANLQPSARERLLKKFAPA